MRSENLLQDQGDAQLAVKIPDIYGSDLQAAQLSSHGVSKGLDHTNGVFCGEGLYTKFIWQEACRGSARKSKCSSTSGLEQLNGYDLFNLVQNTHGRRNQRDKFLSIEHTPEVEIWVHYFCNRGKQTFLKWLIRAESYKTLIEPILIAEGLPKTLFYLAMIESGLNNRAYSRAKASGLWQFVKNTGKVYGLRINYWVDERRDPVKSTVAAAAYLRDLYQRFGHWYLAMAAYNAGPGRVSHAIRKLRTRDFWQISRSRYLKKETRNYVPKMLAAAIIGSNPRKYGFNVVSDRRDQMPLARAQFTKPVLLEELAKKLGVSLRLLELWNPELLRQMTPPPKFNPRAGYSLRLQEQLLANLEVIRQELTVVEIKDVQEHKIVKGDTYEGLSRQYRISVGRLRNFNRGKHPKFLQIGNTLAIPVPSVALLSKRLKD